MTEFKLYRAGLLNNQRTNIIRDIEYYLTACRSTTVNVKDIELYDEIVVAFDKSALTPYDMTYPTYARAKTQNGTIAYYYVVNIEDATPRSIVMTLSRDYVNHLLDNYTRIHGQLVESHLPLSDISMAYELPVPVGDITHIKRNRVFDMRGYRPYGDEGEAMLVMRVILDKPFYATGSRVLLIRQSAYITASSFIASMDIIVDMINESKKVYVLFGETEEEAYDIVEVTDAWIVPYGFAPNIIDDGREIVLHDGTQIVERGLRAGLSNALDATNIIVESKTNVRTLVGNDIINIEVPINGRETVIGVYSNWNTDYRLKMTLRCGNKAIDMSPSFSLGTNTFENDSAEISSKIGRVLGVLTSVVGIGTGIVVKSPTAIAGGVVALGSAIGSGIGIETNANATGADALQSIITQVGLLGDGSDYYTRTPAGLCVTYYDYANAENIHRTINLFGVKTNCAYSGYFEGLYRNNFTYVKFDNVRLEGSEYPPQYVTQLSEMLTRGVHIWNEDFNVQNGHPPFTWSGDFHEL